MSNTQYILGIIGLILGLVIPILLLSVGFTTSNNLLVGLGVAGIIGLGTLDMYLSMKSE